MTRPVDIEVGAGPAKPWNTAWGVVGTPVMLTSFSQAVTSATAVDLTGLTQTFTAIAGRRYRLSLSGLLAQQSVAAGTVKGWLADGSGVLTITADFQLTASGAGSRCTLYGFYINPTSISGSKTWKAQAQTSAGTSTVQVDSATQVTLLIEDIGPI